MELLADTLSLPGYVSDTMALAAVALVGYLFGHRTRQPQDEHNDKNLHAELTRAVQIAKELQSVAGRIRREVALHQSSISRFQSQVGRAQKDHASDAWHTLTSEAEELLAPTMKLASNLSVAYDELRQHSSQLMNFAGSRCDLETGVGNRRALEEQLKVDLTVFEENRNRFSLALFSIEPTQLGRPQKSPAKKLLQDFADLLVQTVRDTDLVARYGEHEFVVLMSQTTLAGAAVFSERLLQVTTASLACVVGGGVVEVQPGDTQETLLSRANSALYSARSNDENCLFLHNGKVLRQMAVKPPVNAVQEVLAEGECLVGAATLS
jgi:diguanylate cyclase (GGDEF)-like protein